MKVRKRTEFGQYIVADPEICHGQLTFKGTRIMVKSVLEMLAKGYDWDRIAAAYPGRITHAAIAEGGAHLDRDTLKALAAVPLAVRTIVQQGIAEGRLRPVHPMAAYFTMFAPIVMFLAGEPIRKELAARHLASMSSLTPAKFIQHLQESVHLALAVRL